MRWVGLAANPGSGVPPILPSGGPTITPASRGQGLWTKSLDLFHLENTHVHQPFRLVNTKFSPVKTQSCPSHHGQR